MIQLMFYHRKKTRYTFFLKEATLFSDQPLRYLTYLKFEAHVT